MRQHFTGSLACLSFDKGFTRAEDRAAYLPIAASQLPTVCEDEGVIV